MKKLVIALIVVPLLALGAWKATSGDGERVPTSVDPSPKSDADSREPRASGERRRDPLPVSGVVVDRAPFVLNVRGTGRAEAVRRAELSSRVGEQVTRVRVQPGDTVERGAVLVEMDGRPYSIALREAKAAETNAQIDFEARLLGEDGIDDKKRSRLADRTGLTRAQTQVARAELDLGSTRLVAPFAGQIAEVDVQVGERATSGSPLVTLVSMDPMRVAVQVFESDFGRLQVGAEAEIRFPSMPTELFQGVITQLGPEIDAQRGTGVAYVELKNSTGRIRPGMYAEARLQADRLPDRLAVPREALLERDKRLLVFRAISGRAEWSYVEIGLETDDWIEIESGIAPGDTVLTQGHLTIAHGAPVKVSLQPRAEQASAVSPADGSGSDSVPARSTR